MVMEKFDTVPEYIDSFPKDTKKILKKMRKTISALIPGAEETMKYGIPTYKLNGNNVVHFGGFKDHVSFFPTPSGVIHFKKELKDFKTATATIQFPLDKPIPYDLIEKIVDFRINENKNS